MLETLQDLIPADQRAKIRLRLQKAAESDKPTDKPKPPQYELLALLVEGASSLGETPVFVLEHDPEKLDHDKVLPELLRLVRLHNGHQLKHVALDTVASVFELLPRSLLKDSGIRLRFKYPALPLTVPSNQLGASLHNDDASDS